MRGAPRRSKVATEASLDVIIPVSERTDEMRALHKGYADALRRSGLEPRFIYVLDGDFEAIKAVLQELAEAGESVEIVQLSRKFGEASAIMAGHSVCSADRLLILPAYFQVDPAGLPELMTRLDDADVVVARRWPRLDSRVKRLQTTLFATLVKWVSGTNYRDLGCGVRALRREVLEDTRLYGDQHRFLPILAEMTGYRVVEHDLPQAVQDRERHLQRPRAGIARLLDLLTVFFLTRFTKRPLRFFGPLGFGCALVGALFLAVLIVQRVVFGIGLADRPALLISSLLLAAGLQIFAIGLVGELLVYIHGQSVKEYKIREVLRPGRAPEATHAQHGRLHELRDASHSNP